MSGEERVNLLLPPWKLLKRFLCVTALLMLGTGISGTMLLIEYFNIAPEMLVGIMLSVTLVFFAVNFRVTRGSMFCASILKYYTLCLIVLCLPLLLIINSLYYYILLLVNLVVLSSAYFLIKSSTYRKLVQYQLGFFDDIREAQKAVESELKK